ncbi:urease accessory protein [Caulobacter ginsengisoli]|uniref:Urease accessory protein UreE n=1 Tax=Caulobacter ginsengisoli TaxID=400775 RepID=A0ABU0IKW6_9CAUL|nr:urease accessory protein UreE [Caulobacter ginsengisoli]MDQ0462656.1 urease accessory protein [Caulobacter ginsengisoli]
MLKVVEILPGWTGPHADHVALDYDGRHRRRMTLTGAHGLSFLLDLPAARLLHGGDGLKLDDGRVVVVEALPEPLMEVRGDDGVHLLRLAWHIGNRHLTAQVEAERILLRYDRVIGHMLEHLGAKVTAVTAPFDPEGGAYGDVHHDHDHDH